MRDEAKKAGRNADEIELTAMTTPDRESVKAYVDAGASRIVFDPLLIEPSKLRTGLEKIANDVIDRL